MLFLGKTVLRNEYFGLITEMKPGHSGYLTGYISSNELIGITKTSKDDLNKKSNMWYYLVKESKNILKNWLSEIGELYERKDSTEKYSKLINSIEEDLNKIINNYPELLNNIPFLSNLKKPTPLSDPNGSLSGIQTDLGQFSKGTLGGQGNSPEDKVPTMGNEEGPGINLDPKGNVKVDTPKKKVKGPRIAIIEEENRKDSVWFDAGLPAFIINGAHPAYFFYQENNNALHAYITHMLFNCILDMQENMEESKRKEYIWNLYGTYLEQVR